MSDHWQHPQVALRATARDCVVAELGLRAASKPGLRLASQSPSLPWTCHPWYAARHHTFPIAPVTAVRSLCRQHESNPTPMARCPKRWTQRGPRCKVRCSTWATGKPSSAGRETGPER